MEKKKSTDRRYNVCLFCFLLLATLGYKSFAQHAVYTPVADALQANTHSTFISSDGKYYLHNNAGNTFFNYWWQAHGIDALLDAYLRTRNDVYKQRMKTLLLGTKDKNGGLYPLLIGMIGRIIVAVPNGTAHRINQRTLHPGIYIFRGLQVLRISVYAV